MPNGMFSSDFIGAGILITIFGYLIQQTLPDWKRPLGPWCSHRNLYFIVIIWIIIFIGLHYENLANSAYYDWTMSGMYDTRESADTMIAYHKKTSFFGSLMWGTFFTGYFLNKHLQLQIEDQE